MLQHPGGMRKLSSSSAAAAARRLQGFIDGIGPMASMPRFLAELGVKVLRSVPLRQMANKVGSFANGGGGGGGQAKCGVGQEGGCVPWLDCRLVVTANVGIVGAAHHVTRLIASPFLARPLP